ncbi:hypothetical protein CcCBS67573_g05290 [Chytriomyces confervae]|uniref:PPM-type phosphatase domain-containing protein n=1 Tax=Chytriomyces confervae TaxID=246404 RepID=A0A507FAZ6_9FUNG|nr:hypothetical protein CcCBS67573_g05290 [Chytriomyces confervae]
MQVAQTPGRKHHFASRTVNEDISGSLLVDIDGVPVWGCFVCDGHGISFSQTVATSSDPFPLSGAERFQIHLQNVLPKVISDLLLLAKENKRVDPVSAVKLELEALNLKLDNVLKDIDDHLCKENGSTLSLALLYESTLFCCNVGDSQILLYDRDDSTGSPLKVWQLDRHKAAAAAASDSVIPNPLLEDSDKPTRNESINEGEKGLAGKIETQPQSTQPLTRNGPDAQSCSFPDSLFLQEGTLQKYITADYALLRERAAKAGGGGPVGGYIHCTKSRYRLGMTASLGNTSHKDNLLVRTNVYAFPVDELFDLTIAGRIALVLTSDGIKDLVKSQPLGLTLSNLPQAIRTMSANVTGSVTPTKRTPISTSISHICTRISPDAHDKNAKEHLEELVNIYERNILSQVVDDDDEDEDIVDDFDEEPSSGESCEDKQKVPDSQGLALDISSPTSKDVSPARKSGSSRSGASLRRCVTESKVAVEALIDLALLRGSTDDITVGILDLVREKNIPKIHRARVHSEAKSISTWMKEEGEGNHRNDGNNEAVPETKRKACEFVWSSQSQIWRVLPIASSHEIPERRTIKPSHVSERIYFVPASSSTTVPENSVPPPAPVAIVKKPATSARNVRTPSPPVAPAVKESVAASAVGAFGGAGGIGLVTSSFGSAVPSFGLAAPSEDALVAPGNVATQKATSSLVTDPTGFSFGAVSSFATPATTADIVDVATVELGDSLGASNMELNVDDDADNLNVDGQGVDLPARRKRKL